jgi:hypothetical protein
VSAYDTALGDAMYGAFDESAGRKRLEAMLGQEFKLLTERLTSTRGDTTAFFVFADTVTTAPAVPGDALHSWMGIRFQARPLARPSQVILHVRLLDGRQDQEAVLGILGVNLIYGARYFSSDADTLLVSLLDQLANSRVEVDFVEFSGPDCSDVGQSADRFEADRTWPGIGRDPEAAGRGIPSVPADLVKNRRLSGNADKPPPHRRLKPARGGLIDSLHMAGIPKAA